MPETHEALPVHGYQSQTDTNVKRVNAMKETEESILRRLDGMKTQPEVDQRWLAIGRTKIEEAFMAINRSIFKPSRVTLPSDNEAPHSQAPGD